MSSERPSLEDQIARGNEAGATLSDPALVRSIRDQEQRLIDRWKRTRPEEKELREQLYHQLRGLTTVVHTLKIEIERGNMAARQAEERSRDVSRRREAR